MFSAISFYSKKYFVYYLVKFKTILKHQLNKKKIGVDKGSDKNITVSLTSIPSRFDKLYLCLETIFTQTLKPNRIVLYLGKNVDKNNLPSKICEFENRGLTIKFVEDKRLKPHTKYFYATQEYGDGIVITLDDDILYDKKIVENLYKSYQKNPDCISCIRCHKIKFNGEKICSYNEWYNEYNGKDSLIPNHFLCATGVGGVLYPPHIFPKEVYDIDLIEKNFLKQDDIYLKAIEIANNIRVVKATNRNYFLYVIGGTQDEALLNSNVLENENDIAVSNMINLYNINIENFRGTDAYDK